MSATGMTAEVPTGQLLSRLEAQRHTDRVRIARLERRIRVLLVCLALTLAAWAGLVATIWRLG